MKKIRTSVDRILEENDKKILLATVIAIFGIILFIALALTLPSTGS